MTRTASRVATAAQVRDGDAAPAQVSDELEVPDVSEGADVDVEDVLVEEVSIDGLCGVY